MIALLLSAALGAQSAAPPSAASPTAIEMSKVIVAGAKGGLSGAGSYDPSCIAAIPEGAVSAAVQQHIISGLTSEEARYLDGFFGSELGQRINADTIAAQAAASESRPYSRADFTLAEALFAGSVTHSPAATKMFAGINSTSGPFIEAVDAVIGSLASRCRVAP